MKGLPFLLATLTAFVSSADLDKIDADGVTEIGGSPQFGRMLTRTKATGFLDASLLPPIADWASQPMARFYYLAGATTNGNGSAQYPFNDLTSALSRLVPDSALIVAPYVYAGSGTLSAGKTLSLVGTGPSSYLQSLTITVDGTSPETELSLCQLRVGSLTVNGGRVRLRLSGTVVGTLGGTSSDLTVSRTDLGAVVTAATCPYTDAYTGYRTVPEAQALVATNSNKRLVFDANRLVVGSSTVAYLSDIDQATNAVYVTIAALTAEDARLAGLITTEALVRASADAALGTALTNAVDDLEQQIADIGIGWSGQLQTLSTGLRNLQGVVTNLWVKETNDVQTLTTAIDGVRTDYAAADTTLGAQLRSEFQTEIGRVDNRITGVQSSLTALQGRVSATETGISSNAATLVSHNTRITANTTLLTGLRTDLTTLGTTVSGHTSSIAALQNADTALGTRITNVNTDLQNKNTAATGRISAIETWKSGVISWQGTMEGKDKTFKAKINEIIDCLTEIKAGRASQITVPAKIP